MIIPDKSKTIIIEGEGTDLSQLPLNEVPYRAADGTIKGSGLRMLSSGALLAPVGFAVESGSVDFGDVLRLSETASFLGLINMVDQKQYQLLDYGVPRNGPSLPPFRFYLKEAEKRVEATNQDGTTLTANPLNFEYTTKLTSRVNALIFKAVQKMENVRMCIRDMDSGVALKYYPSKSSWVTGFNGTTLDAGENILDFGDTALIFQAGTDIRFEIVADNISLAGDEIPWFAGILQEGSFIRIADSQDIRDLQEQINSIPSSFDGSYSSLTNTPTSFPPAYHVHPITEIDGLSLRLSSIEENAEANKTSFDNLATVSKTGSYSDLINKPASVTGVSQLNNDLGFVTIEHTHPISDVVGLQTALNSKQSSSDSITASRVTGLAPVATTGSYADLTNKLVIPTNVSSFTNDAQYITASQIPAISVSWADVQNKPVTFTPSAHQHPISEVTGLQNALNSKMDASVSISYNSLTDKPNLFSGSYNDLNNKPVLFSGSYLDLSNKPAYAVVASTGSYNDLSDKPVIPTINYPVTSVAGKIGNVTIVASDVAGLSNVATSGAYSSLSGLPTIPAGQINSDWNAVSGVSQILNKPVLFSGSYGDLTNKPTSFTPAAHTHTIAQVANLQTELNAKANTSSIRRVETYLGLSNAQGSYTVTYATPFTIVPDVQPQIQADNFNQFVRIVESSVTGFTVQVGLRNTVTLLGLEVLLAATVPVQNLAIGVLVIERR